MIIFIHTSGHNLILSIMYVRRLFILSMYIDNLTILYISAALIILFYYDHNPVFLVACAEHLKFMLTYNYYILTFIKKKVWLIIPPAYHCNLNILNYWKSINVITVHFCNILKFIKCLVDINLLFLIPLFLNILIPCSKNTILQLNIFLITYFLCSSIWKDGPSDGV